MTELLASSRSFDRVISLLGTVKHSGANQATAVCPVCRAGSGNRNHNLSVTYFPQLRETKTNCFSAECPRSAVLDALGLPHWAAHDDEPRPCEECGKLSIPDEQGRFIHEYCAAKREGRRIPPRRPRERQPRPVALPRLPDLIAEPAPRRYRILQKYEVTAEWEHLELTGELTARSVRKERVVLYEGDTEPTVEKLIRPQYFDPAGGGRWCNRKVDSPVEFVPVWRLPEVRDAITAGEPVWGSEGHKAAGAVVQHGGCGTTVLLGALDTATAAGLVGADFRYICDRDATGYAKGLKAMKACEGLTSRMSLWLPAVDEPGADAHDHFAAGYRLDQLVPTDVAHVEVLQVLASVRGGAGANGRLKDPVRIEREARAWLARAAAAEHAGDEDAGSAARANAQLWVRAAGQRLRQLLQYSGKLQQLEAASESDLAEMAALVAGGAAFARGLYEEFGVEIDEDLAAAFAPPAPPGSPPSPPTAGDAGHDDDEDPGEGSDARVYAFPAPEPGVPKWVLSVPGDWRYDDGSNARRGVYNSPRRDETFYVRMAPLPYVHARIVRRDGRGHPVAVDYLLSATAAGPQLTVTRDEIGDGRWAHRLGVPLSWDPKVRQATATAIEAYAAATAPERESIPRIGEQTGLLELPVDLCDQLFRASDCSRDEGLDMWREVVAEATEAPKLAHLIGASAIAPFSRDISRTLAHWVSLTGPMGRGKTQALKLAAAVWGDSVSRDTAGSLYGSWSASHQAVPQMLGELNVMPTFLDEAGATGYTKQQWGQLIYRISLGASRKRTNMREGRVSQERSWHSILFTSANDELTAGIDSGVFQGTIRRVIEIQAPPTASREQGNRLVNDDPFTPGLAQRCYGHLGLQIAEHVTVARAASYLLRARVLLPAPEGDAGEIAAILQLHLAGAVLVDDVLGTGTLLTDAALVSAREVLTNWLPGQSEGDRVLDLIRESLAAQPNAWPDKSTYDAAFNELSGSQNDRHRVMIKDLLGQVCDDGAIAVLPSTWRRFVAEANVSPHQAQCELSERGLLVRNKSAANRDHTFQTTERFGRGRDAKPTRVFKVYLPDPEDDDLIDETSEPVDPPDPNEQPQNPGATAPETAVTRGVTGVTGSTSCVTGGVTGSNVPLTRGVTGVTGLGGPRAREAQDAGARVSLIPEDQDEAKEESRVSNWLDRGGFEGWTSSIHPAKPCVMCGIESVIMMDAMPIHPPCWMRSTRTERADQLVRLANDDGWISLAKPYPPCVVCGTVASQALAGIPLHRGGCEDTFASRTQPVAPPPPTTPMRPAAGGAVVADGPRFLADSAVLDVTGSWLSSGAAIAAPERIDHAGDLADWAISSRLGYGGNRHHRPEPGHVWLSPKMCGQLDLPTGPFPTEEEAEQALTAMRQTPFFRQAEAGGWQIKTDPSQPWLRMQRDKHTVIVTGIGWGSGRYDELLHGDPDPRALAGRLGYLCKLIGYPYTITPPMTGLHSLAYSTTHGLPPVAVPTVSFNDVGANPSWIDLDQLADLADAHPDWWAHKYDRRASYAASAGSAILGTGPALHQLDGCAFDKRVAGIYRLAPLSAQPVTLDGFDLRNPMGYPQVSGWMSRAAVQFLTEHGIEPDILEAYIWDPANSGAQLKAWQATIRDARAALGTAIHAGNPHALAVSETALFKQLYTGAIGSLAATRGRQDPTEPAWRYYPHWRAEIVGTHTVNTLRAVSRIAQRDDPQHRLPIAVGDTDAVVYIGASPDPGDVWPGQGDDALSNPALGKFKPAASIELGHWQQVMAAEQNKSKPRSQLQLIKAGKVWD